MSPNVAASVRARLRNRAREKSEEFARILTQFAAERLLFRLGESAARNRCLLKGARLLTVWLPDPFRATRDVDIRAWGATGDDDIRTLVAEICAVPCPEDGLHFDLSHLIIETIRPAEEYSGKRARFQAYLGDTRIPVQLDIGTGDACPLEPDEVVYPTLLPALPPPRLRAYPRELTVAEKFEAMVSLGLRNSRMKDFHDVWALAGAFTFNGTSLRQAVDACFGRRGTRLTDETLLVLTPAFYQDGEMAWRWQNYLALKSVLILPPARFAEVGERVIQFLSPVVASIVAREAFERTWSTGGPWSIVVGER